MAKETKETTAQVKVESEEQLNEILNDIYLKEAEKDALHEEMKTRMEAEIEALKENIKTLTVAVKGKWRDNEDSKEAQAERFGKIIKLIYYASPIYGNSRQAHSDLLEMGAFPSSALGVKGGAWGDKEWDVSEKGEKAALGTVLRSDATTGSYLIPVEYSAELLRIAKDASAMMGKVTTYPMKGITMYLPKEGTVADWTWVTGQTTAKTEHNPTFEQVTLTAKTCAAWIAITDEMDEDSLIPLGALFQTQWGEGWGIAFDTALLNQSTPFTGILQNTSANIVTMGTGKVGFADFDGDDLLDMISALDSKGKRQGAMYIMHATILDQVMKLKDANGNYIFKKLSDNAPGTIHGYPYLISDGMPDISDSAAETALIAFGNPRHLVHGDRTGVEFGVFDKTVRRVDYDEIFFRARVRAGFVAGQPAAFSVLKTAAS